MQKLANVEPKNVFRFFEEISAIPRGSGNMDKISRYCMEFAEKNGLRATRDAANNVIIHKPGTAGYEKAEPVILQGHMDMVCQKEPDTDIDFEKQGPDIYVDGDYIKARGTTLGADNGIAVAMILAILESDHIAHPPIEAVFTADEEIGLIGASKLSLSELRGRKMINMDAEDPEAITVSCAGGSDFRLTVPLQREKKTGTCITITVHGLLGGHSGAEIHTGRVNADILMGRILHHVKQETDFSLIGIDGGDKGNAIPVRCTAQLVTDDAEGCVEKLRAYTAEIKKEIAVREPGFTVDFAIGKTDDYAVFCPSLFQQLLYLLLCTPCGVMEMSAEIENLVETSLNLGVLKTEQDEMTVQYSLRSNKQSALQFLEEKMKVFCACIPGKVETSGHYPPWEYKDGSALQTLYKRKFYEKFGHAPSVQAIHAGLECGVFSKGLEGLDCIAIGPEMHDIHTTGERLSISSTKEIFEIIANVLKECK